MRPQPFSFWRWLLVVLAWSLLFTVLVVNLLWLLSKTWGV